MKTHDTRLAERPSRMLLIIIIAAVMASIIPAAISGAAPRQKTFASPEDAVRALIDAGRKHDKKELLAIFGPGGREILFSGDKVADRRNGEAFIKAYDEKNGLTEGMGGMVLVIGKDDWPFPIPIVKKGGSWSFDTARGKDEILNRRIGKDEINTIQTCLAFVDAEREYAMEDRDGDGVNEYAQKLMSSPGKKDGLYWKTGEGEKPSPMGLIVVKAMGEGYKARKPGERPKPYYGYYYRLLKKQGRHAPGGAYDYMAHGKMIGGFALVAYPAKYGNSGVMTFIVNQDGTVYQKNLGRNTPKAAAGMKAFDPDKTWTKVDEKVAGEGGGR